MPMLCRLVARHSCAVIEAEERGLAPRPDPRVRPAAPIAGWRADLLRHDYQSDGEHVEVHNRLAEIHDRYGSGHLVSRSIRHATPLFLEAVGDVRTRTGNTS